MTEYLAALHPFQVGRCCLPPVQFHSQQEMDCAELNDNGSQAPEVNCCEKCPCCLASSRACVFFFSPSPRLSLSACWYLQLLLFLFFFSFCEWMLEMCATAAVGVIVVFQYRYTTSKAGTASLWRGKKRHQAEWLRIMAACLSEPHFLMLLSALERGTSNSRFQLIVCLWPESKPVEVASQWQFPLRSYLLFPIYNKKGPQHKSVVAWGIICLLHKHTWVFAMLVS